jgi:hypothetical protein
VQPKKLTPVTIIVTPLVGDGTFQVAISWPQGKLSNPVIVSTLSHVPAQAGDPVTLTIGDETASSFALSIPAMEPGSWQPPAAAKARKPPDRGSFRDRPRR